MAHAITTRNGHQHAAYAIESAWHREGTVFDRVMTEAELAAAAQYPEVVSIPAFYLDPVSGKFKEACDYYHERDKDGRLMFDDETGAPILTKSKHKMLSAVKWDDGELTILGQVSDRWRPVQAAAAFEVFRPLQEATGAIYEAGGVLNDGAQFWVLARLPEAFTMKVAGREDRSERYMLFTVDNTGSGAGKVLPTWVRVVCANTLSMALSDARRMFKDKEGYDKNGIAHKIRHAGDVDKQIAEVTQQVEAVYSTIQQTEDAMQGMAEVGYSKVEKEAFVNTTLGLVNPKTGEPKDSTKAKNIRESVNAILTGGKGTTALPGSERSLWGLFNAVTEYVDHERSYNKRSGRLASVGVGSGAIVKRRALEIAIRLTADGREIEVPIEVDAPTEGNPEDFGSILRGPASIDGSRN